MALDDLRIDGQRLLDDLSALARIGATAEGGVDRPALSGADLEARAWFQARAAEAGFDVRTDGAGNQSAVLAASDRAAQTVMCGSHLDSVPHGGRFDGALGVVAALEVLRTVRDAGLSLPVHLEAVNFTDEEGTWVPLMGSQGLAGCLTAEKLAASRSGIDAFDARLTALGTSRQAALQAGRNPATIRAWVEVHIEQGTRLEETRQAIGVVTGIVGIASYWLSFVGRADHAGTTPMDHRLDALRGVAEFVRQARELVINRFPMGVYNCGIVEVQPGAFNIVPERARLALEFRHSDPGKLEAMREALLNLALHVVEVEGLGLEVEQMGVHPPASMHRDVVGAIQRACHMLNLSTAELASYAGHDTQTMASITRAGMFFVPSVGGYSHSFREFTPDEDCVNAGNVLLHAVLQLARG
jgi:N-carbamoyl-L-amino-acid hydrolase